ncbi:MAG: hypothetical protein MI923_10330 [Phycisphaerales bacterium]|nr:hypothetical protein [Phycisphaerales bacterium]
MNCVGCQYLLWDLPENRCPECGDPFDVTDYAFGRDSVQFLCDRCGQTYEGGDSLGLPNPRRFECVGCGHMLDVAKMRVRPITEDAFGEPLNYGTPWANRHQVGLVRAFLDSVARLAIQPGEYFRLSSPTQNHGALLFSVLCAYMATVTLLAGIELLQRAGVVNTSVSFFEPKVLFIILTAVPFIQLVWNHLYGFFIHVILWSLGLQSCDFERSVRAVAFGNAVLPALLILPPIGLLWYIGVVSSGVEHFNATTRSRALLATLIPVLLLVNLALGGVFVVLYT